MEFQKRGWKDCKIFKEKWLFGFGVHTHDGSTWDIKAGWL